MKEAIFNQLLFPKKEVPPFGRLKLSKLINLAARRYRYLLADTAYYLDIAGSYSQIHVLFRRYRKLGDTGTYLDIQVLTWIYKYLLGYTSTYSEIQVLTLRYRYILGDTGNHSQRYRNFLRNCRFLLGDTATKLEIHSGTYLEIQVITWRYRY